MNRSLPLQRAAMVIATTAAVATLGFAMAAGPSTAPAVDPVIDPVVLMAPEPTAASTEAPALTPIETTEVDTIYVEPAATPEVIQEVRRATPAPDTAGNPSTAAAVENDEEADDRHGESDDDDDDHDDDHDESDDEHGEDDDD